MSRTRLVLIVILLIGLGVMTLANWGYVFSKHVVGEIVDVKQIEQSAVLVTGAQVPTAQRWTFAVAVKNGHSGEIYTSSTEDRQWAVAKSGQCAIAEFYPYPPWDLQKRGTYHAARLTLLCESCSVGKCGTEIAANPETAKAAESAAPAPSEAPASPPPSN